MARRWVGDDLRSQPVLSFVLAALGSDSVGSVTTISRDPIILPAVTQRWSALSDHDTTLLVEAIGVARRLAHVMAPSLGAELSPGQVDDLAALARANAAGKEPRRSSHKK